MTVNADIYLPEPVFSHGQLCVALSTSIARQNVSILAILDFGNKKKNSDAKKKSSNCSKNKRSDRHVDTYMKNIVYREILNYIIREKLALILLCLFYYV